MKLNSTKLVLLGLILMSVVFIAQGQVDPNTLMPGSSWVSNYNARMNVLLTAGTWNCNATSRGDQDNGKRYWPQLLAQLKLADAAGKVALIKNEAHSGVFASVEGTFYKAWSAPGLNHYYFLYKDLIQQNDPDQLTKIASNWNTPSRGYTQRADGYMDPIYTCTEFNSENYNWMNRLGGYLQAHEFDSNTTYYDDYLKNWTRALYNTGRVEWNSHIYSGYNFLSATAIYQFATNEDDKLRGRAGADWLTVETALRHLDAAQVGPESRDKGFGYEALSGSIWPYCYAFFDAPGVSDATIKSRFIADSGIQLIGYISNMTYKPLKVVTDLAARNFPLPVEIQSAKPFYDVDNENYKDWQGNTSRSRRFEFETKWLDKNVIMASVAAGRPAGIDDFVEEAIWRIGVDNANGTALQMFGSATGHGGFNDASGRSPYEEIGQFRNMMMRLYKGATDANVVVPNAVSSALDGNRLFIDMGSGVYVAVSSYNSTTQSSATWSSDGNYKKYVWNFNASDLAALVIELGSADKNGDFNSFKTSIKNNTAFTTPAANQLSYKSTSTDAIKMEWVPTVAYSYTKNNCTTAVINPGGVPGKVWGNNTFIDYSVWNSYEVVFGEKIVDQKWGSGILRLYAGGEGVQIKVDPTTAKVDYSTFTLSGNLAPLVSITSPADNATFTAPASITINANGSDTDGTVSKVEFYQGSTKLGEDTSSPYSYTWTGVINGSYALKAIATDNDGASTTSSIINITVSPASTGYAIPGKVEAENYSAMSGVQTENTSDTGGSQNVGYIDTGDWMDYNVNVATAGIYTINYRVASQAGGGKITLRKGTIDLHTVNIPSTGGWQTWTTVSASATLAAGTQTLRIYATASGVNLNWFEGVSGAANVSPTVSITSPANNATFTTGSNITIYANAADIDGTITKVEFYNGSTKLGEDTSSPYSYTWNSVVAGTYSLTAIATDNGSAATTSTGVTIQVNTAPTAGSVVYAINAGGAGFTATDATVYSADTNFTGGSTFASSNSNSNTSDGALYQSERYGNFSYALPVSASGNYDVTFKLSENYFNSSGRRVFDIKAEGTTIISALDIFVASGAQYRAYDIVKTVNVTDGVLNLQFIPTADQAKIGALLVTNNSEGRMSTLEEQPDSEALIVHPNPATNTLYITAKDVKRVVLYNLQGVVMLQPISNFETLDISTLQPGMYMLQVKTSKAVHTRKVLKQ